jgi:hypothetical protein
MILPLRADQPEEDIFVQDTSNPEDETKLAGRMGRLYSDQSLD